MGETGEGQGAIQRGVPASQAWPVCRSLNIIMGETGEGQGAIQRGVPASQVWPVCRSSIMGYGIWVKQGRHKVPSKGVFQQLIHGLFADH